MKEQKDRYEIFLKVCETGSFSKAAEALNYTQSGISQMMAGLEEELGVQLFARINRGVTLTDNGTRLLPYIRELANQKTRLRQAAFNINHKAEGKLRVGSISSTRPAYIVPYWAALCCACIRFKRPTGRVRGALVELIRVMEMIYSFQKDRKLNRIMVMMDGFAMGKMMRVMVEK